MFKKTESPDYFCIFAKLDYQGIATKLMQELTNWADVKQCTLIAEINPYGDLGRGELILFSLKHGFRQETRENNILFKRAPSGMG